MKTFETLPGIAILEIALMRDFVRNIQVAKDLEEAKAAGEQIDRHLTLLLELAEAAAHERAA